MNKESWEIKKLGEVCDFQGGSQPPKDEWINTPKEGYIRMLQIRDFTQLRSFNIEYIKHNKNVKTCNSDDILIGRYGASVGKILTGLSGAYNVAIIKSIPDEAIISKRYIKFYFESTYFQTHLLNKCASRAAQAGFNKDDINECQILTPPLPIQEQIVAELDTLNDIIRKKRQQLAELDTLAQDTFYELFGAPVENEKGWDVKPINEVSDSIVPGRDKPKSFTGDVPWVNTADLKDLAFVDKSQSNIGLTNSEIKEVRAKIIPLNSIIMTCVGDLGITSINTKEIVINQQLHSYQCYDDVNNIFIMFCLSLRKDYMYKMATSTTLPYMNKTTCNSIPVFLPPLPLQNQFAEQIEAIEKQKELINQSIAEVQKLFDYTMDKYFN